MIPERFGFECYQGYTERRNALNPVFYTPRREILREAARVLRRGGLLYLETPNDQSLEAIVMGERWPMRLPEHLTFYSPREIRYCLEKSGFSKVATGTRYENDEQVNEAWKVISIFSG